MNCFTRPKTFHHCMLPFFVSNKLWMNLLQMYVWCIISYCFTNSWRFVIQGGIDGFSHLIVFLSAATNNQASTVLESFLGAINKFGLPSRVRSDKGGENIEVASFMVEHRGQNRNSHITGRSVHNWWFVFYSNVFWENHYRRAHNKCYYSPTLIPVVPLRQDIHF